MEEGKKERQTGRRMEKEQTGRQDEEEGRREGGR